MDMSRGDNVPGILGTIGPFWAKWRLGRVAEREFFVSGNPDDLSETSERPIFTKFGLDT